MGLNMGRRAPVFIEPEELEVDHFLCTHSHYDHADPELLRGCGSRLSRPS
jgi:L-ascorbate 6-phosphate lactonase